MRQLATRIRDKNMTIIIISQVIDLIGKLSPGRSLTRAGGHGLDHNASQIVWLREVDKVWKSITIAGKPRKIPIGKKVEVKITKNRLYREGTKVYVDILDRYGIDDIGTTLNWLEDWGFLKKEKQSYVLFDIKATREKLIKTIEGDKKLESKTNKLLKDSWLEIQEKITPDRKPKYG